MSAKSDAFWISFCTSWVLFCEAVKSKIVRKKVRYLKKEARESPCAEAIGTVGHNL